MAAPKSPSAKKAGNDNPARGEGCFVEVRRCTRPMVVFSNVESADRIIRVIFSRFHEDGKTHTLNPLTQAA